MCVHQFERERANRRWWDTTAAADNLDYVGQIDEVRLYSLALTEEELAQMFAEIETGVTAVEGETEESTSTSIYDIMGRRLERVPSSGIYIQNGKKYMVR